MLKGERPNELGFGVFALKLPVSYKERNDDANASCGQRPDRNISDRDPGPPWLNGVADDDAHLFDEMVIPGSSHHDLDRPRHAGDAANEGSRDPRGAIFILSGRKVDGFEGDGRVPAHANEFEHLLLGNPIDELIPDLVVEVFGNPIDDRVVD